MNEELDPKLRKKMKYIMTTLITLTISQSVYSVRICEDYITDEWPDSRYNVQILSGDNVVIDKITGLMWKQCSEGLSGADCLTGAATMQTWQQALAIPEVVNTVGFAGYSDWRLPNIEELRSISAINCYNSAINVVVFPNTSSNYWSSSPVEVFPTGAWIVSYIDGQDNYRTRDLDARVRLVRAGR